MNTRKCPKCNICKAEDEFYSRRGKFGKSVYCKPCTSIQTLERQHKFKKLCIEYKGGKCEICGYTKSNAALEFHHLDASEKEFSISKARLTTFSNSIKKELDKCQLLCANCHREVHDITLALSS
ncbi:MAG: hypothetical protein ACP5N7_06465 [Candidatus Pacearchaeota archaeon]